MGINGSDIKKLKRQQRTAAKKTNSLSGNTQPEHLDPLPPEIPTGSSSSDSSFTCCLECEESISKNAEICPYCGSKSQQPFFGQTGYIGAFFLFMSIGTFLSSKTVFAIINLFLSITFFFTLWRKKRERKKKIEEIQTKDIPLFTPKDILQNTIMFFYSSSGGQRTSNALDVRRVFEYSGDVYIEGICKKRNAIRTFKAERIVNKIYIPSKSVFLSPTEYIERQTISDNMPESFSPQDNDSQGKIQVIAPSGFAFPSFPFTEKTLVRIIDNSDYFKWFLAPQSKESQNNFGQKEFDAFFDPSILNLKVEPFEIMLTPKTLKKLRIDTPFPGLIGFYKEFRQRVDDNEVLIWEVSEPIHRQLLNTGLLTPYSIERTEDNVDGYLQSLNVRELQGLCKIFGMKAVQSKQKLIANLIQRKDDIPINPMAQPSNTFYDFFAKLTEAYLKDINKQLKDKPDGYALAIWNLVAKNTFIIPKAQKYVKNKIISQ